MYFSIILQPSFTVTPFRKLKNCYTAMMKDGQVTIFSKRDKSGDLHDNGHPWFIFMSATTVKKLIKCKY